MASLVHGGGCQAPPATYDWDIDKKRYIEALLRYDQHRDPSELAIVIASRPIGA